LHLSHRKIYLIILEMARGSIGRERMLSGVVGNISHPPSALQEDLNNELLAVSVEAFKLF
jgi:hypothetical protein